MKPNQQFITSLKSQPAITFNITATSPSFRTTIGDETLLQITGSGTITITGTGSARILVVAGGGGGSGGSLTANGNKGGGGGQVIDGYYTLTPGTRTTTVGLGGVAPAGNGGSSVISGITPTAVSGKGTGVSGTNFGVGAEGIDINSGAPNVSFFRSGGGGGAGEAGLSGAGSDGLSGYGGIGIYSNITGSNTEYGAGGGGGPRAATASYTTVSTNGSGCIFFPGDPVDIVNAGFPTTKGGGGHGGARASTNIATSTNGSVGVIIIRFRQI
jgi:hypothetical protein